MIKKADNLDILALNDGSQRLDTGMKAEEAVRRAKNWWENKGAKLIKQQAMRQREPVGGSNKGAGSEFATDNPDSLNFLPSAILNGYAWEAMTRKEKMSIVKVWHHFAVRVPDVLGQDPEEDFKLDGKDTVQ